MSNLVRTCFPCFRRRKGKIWWFLRGRGRRSNLGCWMSCRGRLSALEQSDLICWCIWIHPWFPGLSATKKRRIAECVHVPRGSCEAFRERLSRIQIPSLELTDRESCLSYLLWFQTAYLAQTYDKQEVRGHVYAECFSLLGLHNKSYKQHKCIACCSAGWKFKIKALVGPMCSCFWIDCPWCSLVSTGDERSGQGVFLGSFNIRALTPFMKAPAGAPIIPFPDSRALGRCDF